MSINFNAEPYYDDYSENKKFYKILFRPGYSVQARELTQLQTILQKQIQRFGNHVFKEGAMVIPGQVALDTKLAYVKLTSEYGSISTSAFVMNLVGKIVEGQTSGVRAQVVHAAKSDSTAPAMLFLKYTSNGILDEIGLDDSAQKEFSSDEILTTIISEGETGYSVQIQSTNTTANPAIGESSAVSIGAGVYFIKGHFVLVDAQTVILEKFSNKPTAKVGLRIVETLVEPEDDETLLDNAQNSYNYAAPGSHRYSIDAILEKRSITTIDTSSDFIELLRVDRGQIQQIVNRSEYAALADTLARRTYDESGDYTVRQFGIDVREWRDNNRGAWAAQTVYLAGDVVTFNKKKYTAQKNGVSLNTTSPLTDSAIGWEETPDPVYSRGVYQPPKTVSKPVLDSEGNPVFNYDSNGKIISQIFSTQPATVADNEELSAKLAVGLESGKAYVRGYEIEKFGTTYVEVPKARDFETETDVLFSADYGNYVVINNVNYAPDISSLPLVNIYNHYTTTPGKIPEVQDVVNVGTARIRGMEWHSGDLTGPGAFYKLFLFDIKMNSIPGSASGNTYPFNTTAKQFRIVGTSNANSFTADTAPLLELLSGSITFTTPNTTQITGVNTRFKKEFAVGDYIFLDNSPRRITEITSNLSLTIATPVGPQTSASVVKCFASLNETNRTSLLFKLPRLATKTITDISYYVTEVFKTQSTITVGSTCQLIISTSGGAEFTNTNNANNYVLFSATGERVIPIDAVRTIDNLSVTFTLSSQYANTSFIVYATIQKDRTVGLKSKALTTALIVKTAVESAQAKTIWLGKADGIRLRSVKMRGGNFTEPTGGYSIDITSRYSFNHGQTNSYYGICSIVLKQGQAAPVAPIEIVFDYYNHGAGDFFTVDSYSNYTSIPVFEGVNLRDVIDFRPRVDDSNYGDVFFSGNNDLLPKYGADILISYEYYIGRKTKIAVSKSGNFIVANGGSSLYPSEPNDPLDGMLIYKLDLSPFTFDTKTNSVNVTPIENKRYTMRDIGKIEKRVNQLEYYTALSMLEQETSTMSIKDVDGFDRLKNGFVVDSFKSQSIGDVTSPDYMCAIDVQNGILRPFYSMDNVDFVDMYANNKDRVPKNYQLTGDLITLPFTEIALITQAQASERTNINPFAMFTFIGRAELTPPFDRWFEVDRRPDIIINTEGNYAAIMALTEGTGVLGTVWNAWQTQWTGIAGNRRIETAWQAPNILGTTTITPMNEGQSRSGITTVAQEAFERKVSDRTLSVVAIPYIRSRNILAQVKGLKHNTTFYPFFDKTNVNTYCKAADKLVIDRNGFNTIPFNIDSNNDNISNVGSDYNNSARLIGQNADLALNIGDIVFVTKRAGISYSTVEASPTTGIVVGTFNKKTSGVVSETSLSIVNVKDSDSSKSTGFLPGDEIKGSISGATAKVVSHTSFVAGVLTTNDNGELNFMFNIPNTDALRFRTGKKEFALLTTNTYDVELSAQSFMLTEYEAQGIIETKQTTIESVRNAVFTQEAISENRTISFEARSVLTQYFDPLAQTFLISGLPDDIPLGGASKSAPGGGCFLTSVDIYFASKDNSVPVTLQLREVINGYPGKRILPFGEVVMSADDVLVSANSTTPTRFKFKSPVYVQNGTEYAIVLLADSTNYLVWTATLGAQDVVTNTQIEKQPYAGVLFKSQNASTWAAEQSSDLKFKINRAKFKTGVVGEVEFENINIPEAILESDPIQFTAGSKIIRVKMKNHGMTAGAYPSKITLRVEKESATGTIKTTANSNTIVGTNTMFMSDIEPEAAIWTAEPTPRLIGIVSTAPTAQTLLTLTSNCKFAWNGPWQFINTVHGIKPTNLFNKQHTVTAVEEFDTFIITLNEDAAQSGYGGGSGIRATRQIQYDAVQPLISYQNFTNTRFALRFNGVSGKSINGTQVPYLKPQETGFQYTHVEPNEVYDLPIPYMITSRENALARPGDGSKLNISHKAGGHLNSATILANISSNVDTLSPVIDARSISAILISNKVNRPSTAMNVLPIDARNIISNANDITIRSAIVSCYRANNIVTIMTATEHGFIVGQSVKVILVDNTDFNGTFTVTRADSLSFSYELSGTDFANVDNPDGDSGWAYGNIIQIGDSGNNRAIVQTMTSGQTVKITGVNISGTSNNIEAQVKDISLDGSSIAIDTTTGIMVPGTGNISITAYDRLKNDYTPIGSSTYSKYVTKKVQLTNPSTFLKIRFGANIPLDSDIGVFYKLGLVASSEDFSMVEYRAANFIPQRSNDSKFKDVEIDIPDLPEFDSFAIKLVFKSSNSTRVPQIRELRVIACA
jgi:hypothetical protein